MTKSRIPGLDGLRALSIALVLFNHAGANFALSSYGVFGVCIFFVISGFLITWLMCEEEVAHGSVSLRAFYLRRVLRILPPAFLFLACAQILSAVGHAEVGPHDVFYCAMFLRNVFGSGIHTAHFWSLSIEEQFYLGWPLLFILLRSNRTRLVVMLVLFVLLPFWQHTVFVMHHGARFVNPQRFDMRCHFLVAGCALALAHNVKMTASFLRTLATWPVAAGSVALCSYALTPWFPVRLVASDCAAGAVALLINFAVSRNDSVLDWSPLRWVGNLSYSLYLWQQLFCAEPRVGWLGTFPVNIAMSLVLACASFYWLETPLGKLRRRIKHDVSMRHMFGAREERPLP